MGIKVESKVVVETTAHMHKGELKTHPTDIHEWWGEVLCQKTDLNKELENIQLPEGEYKITITLEMNTHE